MANPLDLALRSSSEASIRVNKVLDAHVGSKNSPDGKVYAGYNVSVLALRSVLAENTGLQAIQPARMVIARNKAQVLDETESALDEAQDIGIETAQEQIEIYFKELGYPVPTLPNFSAKTKPYMDSIKGMLDSQEMTTLAMIGAGMPADMIAGSKDRVGYYRGSDISRQIDMFTVAILWLLFDEVVSWAQAKENMAFRKIAIAAIDQKTTDCCLRVHGQIQPLNMPFQLTGTPRYADYLQRPPFHWWCRTAYALYVPGEGDNSIQRMMDASDAELTAREETGKRVPIFPSNAYSGRS